MTIDSRRRQYHFCHNKINRYNVAYGWQGYLQTHTDQTYHISLNLVIVLVWFSMTLPVMHNALTELRSVLYKLNFL